MPIVIELPVLTLVSTCVIAGSVMFRSGSLGPFIVLWFRFCSLVWVSSPFMPRLQPYWFGLGLATVNTASVFGCFIFVPVLISALYALTVLCGFGLLTRYYDFDSVLQVLLVGSVLVSVMVSVLAGLDLILFGFIIQIIYEYCVFTFRFNTLSSINGENLISTIWSFSQQ